MNNQIEVTFIKKNLIKSHIADTRVAIIEIPSGKNQGQAIDFYKENMFGRLSTYWAIKHVSKLYYV